MLAAAKSLGKHIPCNWSNEQADLVPFLEQTGKFLVRVKADESAEVEALFGQVIFMDLDNQPQERAFVTAEMKEADFDESYAKLRGAVGRIRMA